MEIEITSIQMSMTTNNRLGKDSSVQEEHRSTLKLLWMLVAVFQLPKWVALQTLNHLTFLATQNRVEWYMQVSDTWTHKSLVSVALYFTIAIHVIQYMVWFFFFFFFIFSWNFFGKKVYDLVLYRADLIWKTVLSSADFVSEIVFKT